jgi:hypothetical protein
MGMVKCQVILVIAQHDGADRILIREVYSGATLVVRELCVTILTRGEQHTSQQHAEHI